MITSPKSLGGTCDVQKTPDCRRAWLLSPLIGQACEPRPGSYQPTPQKVPLVLASAWRQHANTSFFRGSSDLQLSWSSFQKERVWEASLHFQHSKASPTVLQSRCLCKKYCHSWLKCEETDIMTDTYWVYLAFETAWSNNLIRAPSLREEKQRYQMSGNTYVSSFL